MPRHFLSRLTAPQRTRRANRQLGGVLAFIAGAVNAGGFLVVQRYTSHMSGVVSGIADDLVLGQLVLALGGLSLLGAFVAGAATTALQIHWARRQRLQGEFALPLMSEALLLLGFGLLGANLHRWTELFTPATVLLLSFVMGLQNAVVTKISQAEIRTTHMTGVITDLGIELGRLLYWNRRPDADAAHFVRANRDRLTIHLTILGMFFLGGLSGAWAFQRLGGLATLPISAALMLLAAPPLWRDLQARRAGA